MNRGSNEERERWAAHRDEESGGGAMDGGGEDRTGGPDPLEVSGHDDLDLTGDETPDRTIAELLDDRPPDPGAIVDGETNSEWVRAARRMAERAVEGADVPPRYHGSIRRYFDRLRDTADEASETPPTP